MEPKSKCPSQNRCSFFKKNVLQVFHRLVFVTAKLEPRFVLLYQKGHQGDSLITSRTEIKTSVSHLLFKLLLFSPVDKRSLRKIRALHAPSLSLNQFNSVSDMSTKQILFITCERACRLISMSYQFLTLIRLIYFHYEINNFRGSTVSFQVSNLRYKD